MTQASEPYSTYVKGCARCGEDHYVIVRPLTNPVSGFTHYPVGEFTHWALCPILNEPLMVFIEKEEGNGEE